MLIAFILAALIDTASPAPAASAVVPLPDGTYTYAFKQGSTTLGTSVIAVMHAPDAVKTHEVVTLANTFTVDQTLDPASFVPRRLDAVYPGAKPTAIHVVFGSSISETIAGVPGTKSLAPVSGDKGFVPLDGPVLSGFFICAAQAQTTGSRSQTGVSPGSDAIIPIVLKSADASVRPASVPPADPGYTMSISSGAITAWFDPHTFVPQDLEIPAQGLSIVLTKQAAQPSMQATPAVPKPLPTAQPHFTSRDVIFRSADGTRLAGTLTIPEGGRRGLSAVVLVHGSGPVDRDERLGPNPIFLELSNALSNHGYAVLRYDKRGVGASGGDPKTTTRDLLLADARSAIAFVARESQVDPRKVFVLGHSEGGELAPSLAAAGAPVRGIVLMAPPAISIDKIMLQQATYGLSGKRKQDALAAQEHENLAIRTGVYQGPGAAWMRSSFGIDPADVIKRVPCPILILQGGKDFQVLATDLPRLVDAARSAHRVVTVHIFPNDDHLFITVPSGQKASIAEYFQPHRIDPAMLRALLSWLDLQAR